MPEFRITELDFEEIKTNLKNFLRGQSEFEDYDFDGSGLSLLIDLLAFNTVYGAFYSNMVGAEMFLDSAVLRESLVSRAKAIGYTPRSIRPARAEVQIAFNTDSSFSGRLKIDKGHPFTTKIDNKSYTFTATQTYVIKKNQDLEYVAENVELVEGIPLTHRFVFDKNAPQRFIIPNDDVDSSRISVRIQESEAATGVEIFNLASDILEVTEDSKVFFIQEVEEKKFEVYFGDGVLGRELQDGNVILIDYFVVSGPEANGANLFASAKQISEFTSEITTLQSAFGGISEESDESIRTQAPQIYEVQNRAVTQNDYESLIKRDFPNIDTVRVWGGQDNDPPQYGRVFVSVKPVAGFALSQTVKESVANAVIRTRSIVSLEVILVDPAFTFLVIDSTVKFKSDDTNKTSNQIRSEVLDVVESFGEENLNRFDATFRFSQLLRAIDDTDESITSNLTKVRLKGKFEPTLNINAQYILSFNNQLDKADIFHNETTLSSSTFTFRGFDCFFEDDGDGNISIFRFVGEEKVLVKSLVGTINYTTGKVIINNFAPEELPEDTTEISITVVPAFSDIIPVRNQILVIEEEDITVKSINESLTPDTLTSA